MSIFSDSQYIKIIICNYSKANIKCYNMLKPHPSYDTSKVDTWYAKTFCQLSDIVLNCIAEDRTIFYI